jgi:hypothetical protein
LQRRKRMSKDSISICWNIYQVDSKALHSVSLAFPWEAKANLKGKFRTDTYDYTHTHTHKVSSPCPGHCCLRSAVLYSQESWRRPSHQTPTKALSICSSLCYLLRCASFLICFCWSLFPLAASASHLTLTFMLTLFTTHPDPIFNL